VQGCSSRMHQRCDARSFMFQVLRKKKLNNNNNNNNLMGKSKMPITKEKSN
jgi:hypothetical protein